MFVYLADDDDAFGIGFEYDELGGHKRHRTSKAFSSDLDSFKSSHRHCFIWESDKLKVNIIRFL